MGARSRSTTRGNAHRPTLLALVVVTAQAGCLMAGGDNGAAPSDSVEGVGASTAALVVAEHTILWTSGYDFTENASGVFRHATDGWETVVVSNINGGGGTRHDYGCYRDAYTRRCDYDFSWYAMGLDPSVAIDWNGTTTST